MTIPHEIAERDRKRNEDMDAFVRQIVVNRDAGPQVKQEPANKFDAGKPRLDLIPPEPLEEIGKVLGYGAVKYGQRNWENGMSWGRCYAAMLRHMLAWWGGQEYDPETNLSHLAHAGCCLFFLMAYRARKVGTDDRSLFDARK
jgi:hypothetical protein